MDKPTLSKTLETIRQQFKSGITFLKKTRVNKNDSELKLHHAHWFLVLGSKSSGKTLLLANSELPFSLSRKDLHKQKPYDSNWWITKDAVMLDIPANYLLTKNIKVWRYFIKLVRRFSFQKKLDGIIIVLTLEELKTSKNHKVLIKTLTKRLNIARNRFRQRIPVYFIFNQMDKLEGFNDFFSDSGKEERQQIWGMHLDNKKSIVTQALAEFKNLTARLKSQLIWRLKHHQASEKANAMRGFCDNFNELSPDIDNFIKQIKKQLQKHYLIQGCFFTAAINESKENAIASLHNTAFSQKTHAYFAHDLLSYITVRESTARKKYNTNLISFTAIACIVIIIAAAFTMAYEVGQHEKSLQYASRAIANYQAQAQATTGEKLKAIASAHSALNHSFSLSSGSNLDKKLENIYENTLNQSVLPNIENLLVSTLNNTQLSDTLRYRALKAYIMLSKPSTIDINSMIDTLHVIAATEQSHAEQLSDTNLKSILQNIKQHNSPINVDRQTIQVSQSYFMQIPAPKLAFIILASQSSMNQLLNIDFQQNTLTKNLFRYQKRAVGIPKLYTAAVAKILTPVLLYRYASEAMYGNNTLGHFARTQLKAMDIVKGMYAQYVKNYNQYWSNFLNNITVLSSNSLTQNALELNAMSGQHSGLNALLSTVEENLPANISLSPELAQIKAFQTSARMNSIRNQLATLAQHISSINNSANPGLQAFLYAKQRFIHNDQDDVIESLFMLSQQAPAPLNEWISTVTKNTWQAIMQQTKAYISQQYQKNIYKFYDTVMQNDFPFNSQSNTDLALSDFTSFFGSDGNYSQFMRDQLSGFVNTDSFPYQQLSRDGLSLNISQDGLTALQQAKKIQSAYFNNNSSTPFMRFSIQPTASDGQISAINFTLGSQKINLTSSNMQEAQYLNWPDSLNKVKASITFTDTQNKSYRLKESGPWAILKLLSSGEMNSASSENSWILSFTSSNNKDIPAMQLQFMFKTPYNPFDLSLFTQFKLPENFIQST